MGVSGELLNWAKIRCFSGFWYHARMRHVVILFLPLIVTVVRLARPGGLRSVVAESLLVKHQLRILHRGRKRAPNLSAGERFIAGLCTLFDEPGTRSAFRHRPEAIHASCISTTCWPNESTAYCSRATAGVRLARKDRRKNSSTPSLN